MARNKPTPKPLFAVKHDFYESLDHFVQEAVNLHQMCQTLIELNQVGEPVKAKFKERVDALSAAMLTTD